MTTVDEASQIIQSISFPFRVVQLPIMEAVGKVLQEDILADRDFPPFNRAAMDGIAVLFSSLSTRQPLLIEKEQFAGQPQKQLDDPNNCIEIMTGAVLPKGCDTIIRYEDVEINKIESGKTANIKVYPEIRGEHVHKTGSDRKNGDILISKGKMISSAEVAVALTVGKVVVKVTDQPKIALISTGDELVDPSTVPLPHQIRKSNIFSLKASLKENLFHADDFHLPDEKNFLLQKLREILKQYDVLILSGGVSMGKADFVPETLESLGVKKLFHKIAQRPGKPFWFGVSNNKKVVFALPGNPVSTFVTFYKYCLPWLHQNFGNKNNMPLKAILSEDISFSPPLTYFLQVKVKWGENGNIMAIPNSGKGSGDLANLADCDGFLELPPDATVFKAGNNYPLILFRKLF